jgi:hypothetical protein
MLFTIQIHKYTSWSADQIKTFHTLWNIKVPREHIFNIFIHECHPYRWKRRGTIEFAEKQISSHILSKENVSIKPGMYLDENVLSIYQSIKNFI